jgi:SAM-dependent methyltransferase
MWNVERFPQLRPALWRSFYRALAAYSRRAEYWTFMNYGYVDENPGSRPELASEDQEERYPIYLYHRVAARVDLRGRDVLEVGSGRGGGASYVKRYLGARRVLGVDIAKPAVELCDATSSTDCSFVKATRSPFPYLTAPSTRWSTSSPRIAMPRSTGFSAKCGACCGQAGICSMPTSTTPTPRPNSRAP